MENEKIKILLVDDEEDILEICADAFEMEGLSVLKALSAVIALELLEKETVDVIISDSFMPKMTGEEFLTKLANLKKMPLFYLATGAVDADVEKIKQLGGRGVIVKPFDIDEIVSQVLSDLGKKSKAS